MELIEDADGAPLPVELQRDSPLWAAVRGAVPMRSADDDVIDADREADAVMITIAPYVWPWLPSNDHSDAAQLRRLIRVACYDPGTFTARANTFTEEIWMWQARAVEIVVQDPQRAVAVL